MDQELSEFMNNNDFFLLSSAFSIAAPVDEPKKTKFEYNHTNNESNVFNEEPSLKYLKKKLNATEEKVNHLVLQNYNEMMENVYQQVTVPTFFTKWTSHSIPYTSSIDDTFHAQNTQEWAQYLVTASHRTTGSVSVYRIAKERLRHSETIMIPGDKTLTSTAHFTLL
ncbi:PREDICTED: uncharacterized protein LOC109582282 [Amphimedon queenslandica]|uniref:Uncharacterized protein n=1 Tax=Amphimedon queenslandica TaxID=400682 RepID=A0A1X7USA5_AMPQE|nr:PREDICTED: uncharacterized protein LOC109582282 [Amphimedon queenslandica]XP_019852510.1 PREDICTED: uncharacterized protein LOC109582282 [Amphimedon queenslandica]|eukprot:XP_019852509.1 PREDICTED: uncharacterized protein LOC109582282 [Amphimedon queenslandica]